MASNPEALITWLMDHADDLDFEGDVPEELKNAYLNLLKTHSGYWGKHLGAAQGMADYIRSPSSDGQTELQAILQSFSYGQLQNQIREAKTNAQLETIDYDSLESSDLKRLWSNTENKIVFRNRAYEMPADEIEILHGRKGAKFFANFYNLDIDEARDILRQKDVLTDRDTIKSLEEE